MSIVNTQGTAVRRPKVAVALVSHEMVPVEFAYDLAQLCATTVQALDEGIDFGVFLVSGTYVHTARQDMLASLVMDDTTHILWLDTDMRFPPDALVRLLNHNKGMVGVNYSTRKGAPRFVALKDTPWDKLAEEAPTTRLQTLETSTGLEQVDVVGFGCVLMKTSVLHNLPSLKEGPWFWFEYIPETQGQVGEDAFFCRLLRRHGVDIFVDHDLSKEIGHIGQFTYRTEHVEGAMRHAGVIK